jgi:uncharacterized membrane protein YdjX (TVP38/TMEM64 family)
VTADHVPSVRIRVALVAVVVVSLAALASSDTVHHALLELFEAARGIMAGHPIAGPAAFVALAALSAMLAFFSSAVLVPAAVYAWGPTLTALLLWTGWTLGGLVAYSLAFTIGRSALRWAAPERSIALYEQRLGPHAPFGFVLLFQLALPSEIPGYVLGLARYPLPRYLAALAMAELPYAVGTMLLGAGLISRQVGLLVAIGLVACVAAVVLAAALRRRLS